MVNIVTAEFEDDAAAEAALDALKRQGFAPSQLTTRTPVEAPIVVAVHAPTSSERERATSLLWCHRAQSIELAQGTWRHGGWRNFGLEWLWWRKPLRD